MKLQLGHPIGFSEVGGRVNNQDCIFPEAQQANPSCRLFIVCDGIGGADKGEEASRLACEGLAAYFGKYPITDLTEEYLYAALQTVHMQMRAYVKENGFISRMGTTMALLFLHEYGASIAHIGDSRVYFLRKGQIQFKTRDHKQVYEMVEAGIISQEQAETHPWRNKLSRAIVAYSDEDAKGLSLPDLLHIPNLQAGDYFFLCSDGVLERVDDTLIETILKQDIPDQQKCEQLMATCRNRTKDNYSGYLIRIDTAADEELYYESHQNKE